MKKPWVNVAMYGDLESGRILESFLKNKGLKARTYNDKLLQLFLFLCPPHATYRVQVPGDAFKNATELLDAESPAILEQAIHCPECGSLRVNYPQMTRKFFLPTLLLHLGIIFRVIEHECYCENCHYVWNLPKPVPAIHKAHRVKPFPFK